MGTSTSSNPVQQGLKLRDGSKSCLLGSHADAEDRNNSTDVGGEIERASYEPT